VALEKPCKECQGIVIGQLKDSRHISTGSASSGFLGGENSAIVTAVKGIREVVSNCPD
jgi:hypothetical protein